MLQFYRSVRLHHKWFSGENKDRKTTTLQETQEDQIFQHYWHYWVLMPNRLQLKRFHHWQKLKYAISRCYIFLDGSVWFLDNLLRLCDLWKGRSGVNGNVFLSPIFKNGHFCLKCHFLCHRNFPRRRNWTNCQLLRFFSQFSPKYWKHCNSLYLKHFEETLQDPPKSLPYWHRLSDVTKPSVVSVFFKMFPLLLFFFNADYR